jgi:hypothetical protein
MQPMLYAVTARLATDRAGELLSRLSDGSIAAQRPDGQEIVEAMARARVAPDGTVRWTETCYCRPPLQHERQTVLDRHFDDIGAEAINAPIEFSGRPLMDVLEEIEDGQRRG